MTPLVQIIHLSDPHVRICETPPRALVALQWSQPLPMLHQMLAEGMAAWDTNAWRVAKRALKTHGVLSSWGGASWFLVTGDMTTFGDEGSIERAIEVKQRLAGGQPLEYVRGNHDTWPGDFPARATNPEIDAQKKRLARLLPQPPSGVPRRSTPAGPLVQVFATDTAYFDPALNTFALGHADGAKRLSAEMWAELDEGPTLRVVLTHHPMSYPAGVEIWHRLRGRHRAALQRFTRSPASPPVQIILSGHTHSEWPPRGQLKQDLVDGKEHGLAKGQVQLVIGSFSQSIGPDRSGERRQQFQVLRIWARNSEPTFRLERTVFERAPRNPFVPSKAERVDFDG